MITVQDESSSFLPTRSSLLFRLKEWNDSASWDEFFQAYNKSIHKIATGRGLTRVEADEVVQETMVAVARHMPEFSYDRAIGSFKSWLFTITRRSIGKHLKKRLTGDSAATSSSHTDLTEELESYIDPAPGLEQQWDEEWRLNLIHLAMDRVRRRIKPKQYQLFDLYVTQHLPLEQVKKMLNVSSAQVYMAKLRVSAMVRHEVNLLEKKLI
jgi:RNA polymerase sigma factor (sigma-70 family)